MSFDLDFGFASLAGRQPVNEDFAALLSGHGADSARGAIAAMADGVSDGGLGREAAQTTVQTVVRDYFATPEAWDTTVALDRVIGAQNAWLQGTNRRRLPALGRCSLTALALRGQTYTVAHVGETRAYLLRGGDMLQLTTDHVLAQPTRPLLTRAVGQDERLLVDYVQGDVQSGDLFLLLSVGVHGSLPRREILALLARGLAPQALCDELVRQGLRAGSSDNLSALAVRVCGPLAPPEPEPLRVPRPALPELAPGTRLDGFEIEAQLAPLGPCRQYRVRDPLGRRQFLLKTPAPGREAEAAAMLAHEAWLARRMQGGRAALHLPAWRDGPAPGREPAAALYQLVEWPAGRSLAEVLAQGGPLAPEQVLNLAAQALRTLALLHRQGVVHRGLTLAGLWLGDDGVLRLPDLGRALSGREPAGTRALAPYGPGHLDPALWPEGGAAAQGGDTASDLYALAAVLHQLLSGRPRETDALPWRAPSRDCPQVPIWLDKVVLRALASERGARPASAEALLQALESGGGRATSPPAPPVAGAPPPPRRPPALWPWALLLSLLCNALLIAAMLWPSH